MYFNLGIFLKSQLIFRILLLLKSKYLSFLQSGIKLGISVILLLLKSIFSKSGSLVIHFGILTIFSPVNINSVID